MWTVECPLVHQISCCKISSVMYPSEQKQTSSCISSSISGLHEFYLRNFDWFFDTNPLLWLVKTDISFQNSPYQDCMHLISMLPVMPMLFWIWRYTIGWNQGYKQRILSEFSFLVLLPLNLIVCNKMHIPIAWLHVIVIYFKIVTLL